MNMPCKDDKSILAYNNILLADKSRPNFSDDMVIKELVNQNREYIKSILRYRKELGKRYVEKG
jgi:hypothetical protein